jgi:hypothetical protein
MKKILLFLVLNISYFNFAQQFNWHSLDTSTKHLVFVNTGWDYGLGFGGGYGFKFKTARPLIFVSEINIPSGKRFVDDYKIKSGLSISFYKIKDFQFSGSCMLLQRRYENSLVTINNIGTELNLVAGYYRKYFIAAEIGYDKALLSHLSHTEAFKQNIYAEAKNKWYRNTGGIVSIGVQIGFSFKKSDLSFKIGKLFNQNLKTSPLIPYYMKLSYCLRLGAKPKK